MQVTPWLVLDVLVAMLIAPLTVYTLERYLRRDQREELLAFGVLTLGIFAWVLIGIGIDASTTVSRKMLCYNVGNAVAAPLMVYSFLWFAVAYSRVELFNRKLIGVLGAVHVAGFSVLLLLWPGFLYEPVGLIQRGPMTVFGVTFEQWVVLDRTLGLSFKLTQLYIYVVTSIGGVILARYLYRNRSAVSRQQTALIAIGVATPLFVNGLVFTGVVPPNLNATDLAFGVTGLTFAIATFRYRLFRLVPMGREQLVETMSDPVVMLDEHNRVVDSNAAARELSGTTENWRGTQVTEFLAPFPGLLERLGKDESVQTEIGITVNGTERHFDLDVSRITPTRRRSGRLIVMREITQRKYREQQLETQRNNLDVLNTMMRHDIRNTLQLVTAYGETLEEYIEDEGRSYLDQVQTAAEEAIDITRTARDVTEVLLKAGNETNSVALQPVLEEEIAEARARAESAAITVSGSIEPVQVQADEMLDSVFRNLFKNAIEHNDSEQPEVVVSTETAEETVQIRVADNGPGIPPELRESIFAEGETGLQSEGTGLGLYLVQTLIDRYDGAVWIEETESPGTVFVIELQRVG